MTSKRIIFSVAFALLVQIFDCDGGAVGTGIKLFKQKFLDGKQTSLDDVMDNLLETFTTVSNIDAMTRDLAASTEDIPELTTLTTSLADLSVLFDKVDHAYNLYVTHRESGKDAKDPSLYKFLSNTRNPYQGPIDYLNTIYSRVVPKNLDVSSIGLGYMNDVSVLSLLTKHTKGYKVICDKHKSQQQILYMLYMSLGAAEMKVYSILEFTFRKLSEIQKCDYDEEIILLKDHFRERSEKAAKMFERLMSIASKESWRCDPKNHVEDETYTELKEVFQKYIINDEDMNNENNCKKRCGDFRHATATGCANKEDFYDLETDYNQHSICDQQRKCNGDLHDCEDHFSEYNQLWICPSPQNSSRRYEFIKHGSVDPVIFRYKMKHYGRKGEKNDCKRHLSYNYREYGGSWSDLWRHCETCLCTCHDYKNPTSEQQINVRPIVADNDYVITGAKLVKKNHILHIQVEQGKILSDGRIDEKTLHWKDINEPRNVYDLRSFNWVGFRAVYLGVTEVPKDRVMVGLKFAVTESGSGQMLVFKTISVPYDFETGKLTYTGQYYVEPKKLDPQDLEFDPMPNFQKNPLSADSEVNLEDCDVPSNTNEPSVVQPESKKLVRFTTSDFKKDLGQSMIPFFDIQDVTIRPPVPLSGISFYHKNSPGYGGFLGVKLNTYDFSSHL